MTALILIYFNFDLEYIVEIDSSDYILGEVLSQYNKNGELCLVAFFFKNSPLLN